MAEEFEVYRIDSLPLVSNVSDSDCLLIVQGGKPKRVRPSLMKGKKGDQGLSAYLGVTATYIVWKLGIDGAWQSLISIASLIGPRGEKPIFKKVNGSLMMKYAGEPDTAYVSIFDREELKMKFTDLTPAEVNLLKLHFADLTTADKAELMKPATEAAAEVREEMIHISQEANQLKISWSGFSEKAIVSEKTRTEAEAQRIIVELLRVEAETARASAEKLREDAEELRDETESRRINAESGRKETENSRVLVEGLRVDEETKRAAAELIRSQSEQGRVTEEVKRVEEEKKRAVAEVLRDKSEQKRDETEDLRNQAETLRASEETDRDNAEQGRITEEGKRDGAEKLRISSETTRSEAEDARIMEEHLRKTAEQGRDDAETGRETAEEAREVNTNQAILDAEEATKKSKVATTITLDLNAHPMKIMGGIWFEWNVKDQEYRNTGIQAKGNVGSSFKIIGRYDTLDDLKLAVPDGTNVDGVYAIGAVEPFSYYAWLFVDGVWQWDNQGKLRGAEGKSSFEVWTEKPENAGKTEAQYFDWLSPLIDLETGRWKVQGVDQGVQALGIDAEVTEKANKPDTYILHVKSASGEFDTPNLRGFDVKVVEDETNTPDNYKLKITTVAGEFTTPNLKGRSGSSVIDVDHEPTEADTHYTYNGVQYAFGVGDEVRWYDVDSEAYVLFKCYAVTEAGAVWEELGSGGVSLPADMFLSSPTDLSADESDSYIYLKDGYLKGKEE